MENTPAKHLPFMGREIEMTRLRSAWQSATEGDPQLFVVLAESGIGKTRLVQHFYTWLSESDWVHAIN